MNLTPVDILTIERNAIDWVALRSQKASLFAAAVQMGVKAQVENDPLAAKNLEQLEGLLAFLDYIQDRAALTYGELKIFGETDVEEE